MPRKNISTNDGSFGSSDDISRHVISYVIALQCYLTAGNLWFVQNISGGLPGLSTTFRGVISTTL